MPNFFHNYPYTDFHELNLDWCISNIQKLLTYFEGLSKLATVEYVDTEVAKAKAACEAMIADLENRKLDKTTFDNFVYEVQQSLNSIVNDINVLERATADNAQAIIDTFNTLKNYIDSQLIDLHVINPLTGISEPIQLVLNYMANLLRGNALTASEYDGADLTATAYDALQLTAYNYDNYGKDYITP